MHGSVFPFYFKPAKKFTGNAVGIRDVLWDRDPADTTIKLHKQDFFTFILA